MVRAIFVILIASLLAACSPPCIGYDKDKGGWYDCTEEEFQSDNLRPVTDYDLMKGKK